MIYEYAMDPEFLLELAGQTAIANMLCNTLRIGRPYVLAGYPEDLGDIAMATMEEEKSKAKEPKQQAKLQERKRQVVELAAAFAGPSAKRTKRYSTNEWYGSFAEEHLSFPFEGILTGKANSPFELPFKNMEWLRGGQLWSWESGINVRRSARDLCDALTPLLQNASSLTFVEPYFFTDERFRKPYALYFKAISKANHVRSRNGQRELLIICSGEEGDAKKSIPRDHFRQACDTQVSPLLPDGLTIRIHRIKSKPNGQEIHNRYILSDIGGVLFGHGTDSSRKPDRNSDDAINLLSASQFAQWSNDYTPNSNVFDWSETPVILNKQGETSSSV